MAGGPRLAWDLRDNTSCPGSDTMTDDFENHCWKDVISPDVLELYSHYQRKVFVGPAPALLAIDLYELAYQGGARPPAQLHHEYPSSCGEHADAAIQPTKPPLPAQST